MKSIPASLVAMIVGWALPLIGTAVGQWVTVGRTNDIGATAFWVGGFALVGWGAAVVPAVLRFGERKWVSDVRWSWLGWSLMGTLVYSVISVPFFGWVTLVIAWYPALMGMTAGLAFALLVRGPRRTGERRPAEPLRQVNR